MLLDDTLAGNFGVWRVRRLHDCGVPGAPEWPLNMQLSARVIEPTFVTARVSHIRIAPSRPPVAKTAASVLRKAAVFTERVCPLNMREFSKLPSRTSHRRAVWSPDAEMNFMWPGIHSRSKTALWWHCWPARRRSLSGVVLGRFVSCSAICATQNKISHNKLSCFCASQTFPSSLAMAKICSLCDDFANLAVNMGGSGLKSAPSVDGAIPIQLSRSWTHSRPNAVSYVRPLSARGDGNKK